MSTLRIALTGGIGSGKSTVSSKFHELGVPIIDSDEISRDIVKPDKPGLKLIIEEFGTKILTDAGTLDRKKLRNIIFNDDNAKNKLEKILHPVIYKEIEKQISKVNYPYCITVIPLLIETQAMNLFDRVIVVETIENIQLQRASRRDATSSENIEKIIKSQASKEERLKYADDVINNDLTIQELDKTVLELHEKYLKLSSHDN